MLRFPKAVVKRLRTVTRGGRPSGPWSDNPSRLLQFRPLAGAKPDPSVSPGRAPLHLRFGWWSVLVFGALGLVLETLHGFKVGAYVNGANETRRLMWTLAHAHGSVLGLVHIAFAVSLPALPPMGEAERRTSRALVGASLLLPGGFFLGGVRFYAGDPGIGVAFVPVGAAFLLVAAWTVARAAGRAGRPASSR